MNGGCNPACTGCNPVCPGAVHEFQLRAVSFYQTEQYHRTPDLRLSASDDPAPFRKVSSGGGGGGVVVVVVVGGGDGVVCLSSR